MGDGQPLGLGLIGCGGFGLFCARAYSTMTDVRLVAAARARKKSAQETCKTLGIQTYDDPRKVIANDQVDIIHVATPPRYHYDTVLQALAGGKHVLCEKPLSLRLEEAEEMVKAAHRSGRFLVANFVMRYAPITKSVKRIVESKVLGRVLGAGLSNCASDAGLGPDHWFWDKSISGGIFIEHGVHFFDLYHYWLGPGRVVSAHPERREGTDQEDRVLCTVRHGDGTLTSHYHSFDQIEPMDRTQHRLICEMGDIRVEGWIPLRLTVDAAVNDATANQLTQHIPQARVEIVETYGTQDQQIFGRGKIRDVKRRIRLHYAPSDDMETLYVDCVRSLLKDQIAWIRDPKHVRRVTEDNGLAAQRYAHEATMAHGGKASRVSNEETKT